MAVAFALDDREVKRALAQLGAKIPRVVTRSLNRTISSVRTRAKREISNETGLKVGAVNKAMSIIKATANRFRAILSIKKKGIPIIDMGARQTRRGVTYSLGGQRRRLSNAFIATMPTGRRGVFARKGKPRLPIRERFGPSIATIFLKRLSKMRAFAEAELVKNLRANIKFAMRGG